MPQHISSLTKDGMDKIREAYAAFINSDDLDVEIERWKFKLSAREGEVSNTAVSLQDCFFFTHEGFIPKFAHCFSCTFNDACYIRHS